MAEQSLPYVSTNAGVANGVTADHEDNSADDGLGELASEDSCDSIYLHTDPAAQEEAQATVAAADLKILHSSGASKMKRKCQGVAYLAESASPCVC